MKRWGIIIVLVLHRVALVEEVLIGSDFVRV